MDDPPGNFPALLLDGTYQAFDAVIGHLFERGCLGIEAVDDTDWQRAYFPSGTNLHALTGTLTDEFTGLRVGPIEVIPERDWVALSRKDMSGFGLGERFFVCPSWESRPEAGKTSRFVLRIDPQQAFGTGLHDTTRLCVEMMERYVSPGRAAIDVGTGTGILAMVAAVLGYRPVVAIEIDPTAATCARRNAKQNGLGAVKVVRADIESSDPPPARLLVANLNRPLLDRVVPRLSRWLEPGGNMILSGILVEDVDEMVSMLASAAQPLRVVRYHTAGGWAALRARSPARSES